MKHRNSLFPGTTSSLLIATLTCATALACGPKPDPGTTNATTASTTDPSTTTSSSTGTSTDPSAPTTTAPATSTTTTCDTGQCSESSSGCSFLGCPTDLQCTVEVGGLMVRCSQCDVFQQDCGVPQ